MNIIIQTRSELPIYAQIKEQIREQILQGELQEGEVLPSIRHLASQTGVSVITTTRAYSDLQAEGYIATIPGKGTVVLPQDNDLLKEQYRLRLEEGLRIAITAAGHLHMDLEEVEKILKDQWEEK